MLTVHKSYLSENTAKEIGVIGKNLRTHMFLVEYLA